jgi:hypothetical protein
MEQIMTPEMAPMQLEREPKALKKPKFPHSLYDEKAQDSSKFIDPSAEAAILLPERTLLSTPVQVALEQMPSLTSATEKRKQANLALSLYEYLMSWFMAIKKSLAKKKGRRAKLTPRGQKALDELRHLSLVCDATEIRSNEEILSAESAFGEAYFEILTLSSNLERMGQKEEEHHTHRYSRHMSHLLKSTP